MIFTRIHRSVCFFLGGGGGGHCHWPGLVPGYIDYGHGYSQSGSAYKQCCNAYTQSSSAHKQCCNAYSQTGSAHKQCENGLFAERSQNFNLLQK